MYFFATGSITNPGDMEKYQGDETLVLEQLRGEGTVRGAYRFVAKHGVIGIFEGPTLEEVQVQIARLPFVIQGILSFEYAEVAEL